MPAGQSAPAAGRLNPAATLRLMIPRLCEILRNDLEQFPKRKIICLLEPRVVTMHYLVVDME